MDPPNNYSVKAALGHESHKHFDFLMRKIPDESDIQSDLELPLLMMSG